MIPEVFFSCLRRHKRSNCFSDIFFAGPQMFSSDFVQEISYIFFKIQVYVGSDEITSNPSSPPRPSMHFSCFSVTTHKGPRSSRFGIVKQKKQFFTCCCPDQCRNIVSFSYFPRSKPEGLRPRVSEREREREKVWIYRTPRHSLKGTYKSWYWPRKVGQYQLLTPLAISFFCF